MRDNKSIEGLRVVLFLCIFLFHAWGQAFPLGWAGINMFLVITAYFLTRKYWKKSDREINVKDVMKSRAKRLYPPFIVVVLLMTAVYLVLHHQLPGDFFSYFLFAQNYQWLFAPKVAHVPGAGHFWYLTLDFYLVLIWLLVFKFLPKLRWKEAFVFLLLFSIAYRSVSASLGNGSPYMLPWGMMDMFTAGGLLAIMQEENSNSKLPWFALIIGIVGFALCTYTIAARYDCNIFAAIGYYHTPCGYTDHPLTVQIHLVMGLLSFFIVWLCVTERKHYNILSNSVLYKWGGG